MILRALLVASVILLPLALSSPAPKQSHRDVAALFKSPLGLAVDERGERAFVALHTAGAVAVVDLLAGKVLREVAVGERPSDVAPVGDNLYVTVEDRGALAIVDCNEGKILRRSPMREAPREVASRLQQNQVSDREAAHLGLGEATNVRGKATYKSFLFLAHQRPRNHIPATQVAQGWVFTNAVGFLVNMPPFLATLDEPQRGFADPSDLAITPDGRYLFIACAGADNVLVVDRERLFKAGRVEELLHSYAHDPRLHRDDLTASRHYVIATLPTQANPRRLALSGDGKTLVVSNYLADSLTVIDAGNLKVLRHIPLGGPAPVATRRGEILFHSARLTFQAQFSCASCHPHGGSDGLTWDLERDGIGTFKRTKSLLGVKDTAPYGWHGSSPTLADRVTGTLRSLHRHEPRESEVDDLVAYLESLPAPKPPPPGENDRPAVARGKAIFQRKALCSNCHQRAGFDDGKSHDVGTQDRFDTPALRGVSRSRSFLHDGRAKSLEEIFTKHNPRQRHGAAHLLSQDELADLIAYLKSL